MKLNTNRAKSSSISTGAAVAGAVAAHAGIKMAQDALADKAPKLLAHVPAVVVALAIGAQALDLVPAGNQLVNSALLGASVTSGMAAVREYTGANNGETNGSGVAKLVNQYVPALNGVPSFAGYPAYQEMPAALLAGGRSLGLLSMDSQPQPQRNSAVAMLS